MKIAIANDHGGVKVKKELVNYLELLGHVVINYGCDTTDSVDYPIYAFKVGEAVRDNICDIGILICKSGIGMSMAANKVKGIRCAKVDRVEDASLTRIHNRSNVLALGANNNDIETIKKIVYEFINTELGLEEKYIRRASLMDNYDN